ncbi:MAG: hypothetical protein OEW90_04025 [Betaproteobacteria bacterium]|nr:hypothetical protein [Betaproteobacteria bacterium]
MLLGVLAYAHASVSLAACQMERGTLVEVVADKGGEPCDFHATSVTAFGPLNENRCVAHCTADLQIAGAAMTVCAAANGPVLHVAPGPCDAARDTGLRVPPPGTPPPRILQHSFQV